MEENYKVELWVNNSSIELNPFVEQFLARTVAGAVSSLKEAGDLRSMELHIEQDEVSIIVSGKELSLTPFPKDIISGTITGLVSSLKGVGKIDRLKISVKAQ